MPTKKLKQRSADNGFSLISDEKLLALYAALLKCRMLSRRASIAAPVGIAIDLGSGDSLSACGTDLLSAFVKGASLPRTVTSLQATRPATVSGVLKGALRAARVRKAKKSGSVAVAFCGDPAAAANLWRETLRGAASEQLPILFVCRPSDESEELATWSPQSGFPIIVVDCNDVVALYRVGFEAIAHARRGNGPTLIVCRPWRLAAARKSGSMARKARSADAGDPIVIMEKYLDGKKLFSAEFKKKTIAEFRRELRTARSIEAV